MYIKWPRLKMLDVHPITLHMQMEKEMQSLPSCNQQQVPSVHQTQSAASIVLWVTPVQEDCLLPLPADVQQMQPQVLVDQHWLVCLPQHKPEQCLLFLKVCTQDNINTYH
jgi:hypothetical protein